MKDATYDVLSEVVGWIYFFAWSFSFYPQIFVNIRKQRYSLICLCSSVAGFSLEFALLNVSGFYLYSLYSVGGTIFYYPFGTG